MKIAQRCYGQSGYELSVTPDSNLNGKEYGAGWMVNLLSPAGVALTRKGRKVAMNML